MNETTMTPEQERRRDALALLPPDFYNGCAGAREQRRLDVLLKTWALFEGAIRGGRSQLLAKAKADAYVLCTSLLGTHLESEAIASFDLHGKPYWDWDFDGVTIEHMVGRPMKTPTAYYGVGG